MRTWITIACTSPLLATVSAEAQQPWRFVLPEQRRIDVRDPSSLPHIPVPLLPPPETVSYQPPGVPEWNLSLDEAIRVALANADVVRVLAGVAAAHSGRTIYDPAVANTLIDEAQGVFDPTLEANNLFNRFDRPSGIFDPTDPALPPTRSVIRGTTTSDYDLRAGASKRTVTGGTLRLGVNTNPTRNRTDLLPLNPNNRSSVDLSYVQPLLQGAGPAVNRAPIVIARIDTERSYFQFKDGVQDLVRGVIEVYWQLVFARVDVWARQQQVEQLKWAYDKARDEAATGGVHKGVEYQAAAAYEQFRAQLIAAEANQLQREAALANILGLPPAGIQKLVPVTPLPKSKIVFDWPAIVGIAEQRRPDIVELKIILEADQQMLLQSRNRALPRVDASMLYRWNGLNGRMPSGASIATSGGDFADWTLGVNFSVPLGLRAERSAVRRQQISIARDRANLQQGWHNATHLLAISLRNLAQFYGQYQAFTRTRTVARKNIDVQWHRFDGGLEGTIFLDVLQAITLWGNAVSSQAQSLAQYNTELAILERQTGTILEQHGIRFIEERFASLGPLGRMFPDQYYPRAMSIGPNGERYPVSDRPAEEAFNLQPPVTRDRPPAVEEEIPRPSARHSPTEPPLRFRG